MLNNLQIPEHAITLRSTYYLLTLGKKEKYQIYSDYLKYSLIDFLVIYHYEHTL